ncbi:FKBP-type peptidyl-prolyl cis-trans isomerase [Ehrlichia ruminantium]|uniref:FKBP-type peptidyl-prolyl cis-trans isomerase n=2 Tax=Ehrlichia ruminantium TaxID=779 RepID=UPI0015DCB39E|nr:FKBP-type peptidyl-prolyl cis-trans isomerase [Ehrlichia ruminantium]QLK50644.1 FKBP-type peptidyl-prolyl cis-trans isomerase [Ehrlichia ruminantium]QLK51569.1 FKBP-type peptidyl-prolyl cis-trans isomerase [Ehrlichia ruminantium]QLK53404.1 FKBP-type peptidyl-prolyl cis-trans isomerase [Ehrlichia ruminantium]QLK58904.1 FKBP-type peptidyl-prolyl cis-trans isomerase [Ehrlichia ruminantium]
MMKKVLHKLLYVCLIIVVLITIGKIFEPLFIKIMSDKEHIDNSKPYHISFPNSFTYNLGYKLLRPIIESRIDHYIKENGLAEYLSQIKRKTIIEDLFTQHDYIKGSGKTALCGQNISAIIYKFSYTDNSKEILSEVLKNTLQEIQFKLGDSIIKEINYAIDGMKEGGERIVILTDQKGIPKEQYYIKLVSVNSTYPDSINNLLIFSSIIESYEGIVNKFRCGDTVSIKYDVRELNGNTILQDQELKFTIGKNEVPLAIELGVINMRQDMARHIIAPLELLTNFDKPDNFDEYKIKLIDITYINQPQPIQKNAKPSQS